MYKLPSCLRPFGLKDFKLCPTCVWTLFYPNKALSRLLVLFVVLTMGSISSAEAANPVTIFDCHLPGGKIVTVTESSDNTFTYRHGTKHSTDMMISGTPTSGNLFYWFGRYAGLEFQLRFTKGDYSYIVYSLGPNPNVGASGSSGVEVFKGTKDISDPTGRNDTCTPFADLDGMTDDLPVDNDSWDAISH